MKILKKISAKDVLGNVTDIVVTMAVNEIKDVYSVAGICDGYEQGVGTYGEWTRFVGNFEAINYVDGEVIRSSKAHVPDVMEQLMLDGVKENAEIVQSKSNKDSTFYKLDSPIEFAILVQLKRLPDTDKEINNYQYITKPLHEVKRSDAIGHLTSLLPAPKADPQMDIVEESEKPAPTEPEPAPAKKTRSTAKK